MMRLAEVQTLLGHGHVVGDGHLLINRVHSDSRSIAPGDLFVALRGEHFDGHAFLTQARQAGAVASIAQSGLQEAELAGVEVPDSLLALQQLAQGWRARFHLPVIAVTGSNGKTTVTQMVASILQAWLGEAALATRGNHNNHIGVPLTLLRLRPNHRAAVLELGMNHPGEIGLLARCAAPTIALVNNAQREHQEFMRNVEAVARENGSVIDALPADGVAIYPVDDPFAPVWRELAGPRLRVGFALAGNADLTAHARWEKDHWDLRLTTPSGPLRTQLHCGGWHNVKNALAAAACALAAGCPNAFIAEGLQSFVPVSGRSHIESLDWAGRSLTLVDDSYNANPDSVRSAIDMLATLPGPRWLVLGDMGEVGIRGPEFHTEIGAHARDQGIDSVWTVGPLCRHTALAFRGAQHFDSVEALVSALAGAAQAGSVLVKGSRFMRMERVVAAIRAEAKASHAA